MVAASSYQKEGRPAPPRLTAAANTPTISGSHTTSEQCQLVTAKCTTVTL